MSIHRIVAHAFIASFLIACICAQAVPLNPRGQGEVLIYPYYTVNKGQDTLISIGNASQYGKRIASQSARR